MASSSRAAADLVGIETLPENQLLDLFEAERRQWRMRLGWELVASAETMVQAVEWGLVRGAALLRAGRAVALLAHQPAARPSLARTCSVHLRPEDAPAAAALVGRAIAAVAPGSRIEGQLAAFEAQPALDAAFRGLGFAVEPREFLALDGLLARRSPGRFDLEPLEPADVADCARVLVAAHATGVEARINSAFRTEAAARDYLQELLDLGGCGRVLPWNCGVLRARGAIAGFCIASSTAPEVGHVSQLAVMPAHQGRGLGAALLGRAVDGLRADGYRRVTLSVSKANGRARAWYRRAGFERLTWFAAHHREGGRSAG